MSGMDHAALATRLQGMLTGLFAGDDQGAVEALGIPYVDRYGEQALAEAAGLPREVARRAALAIDQQPKDEGQAAHWRLGFRYRAMAGNERRAAIRLSSYVSAAHLAVWDHRRGSGL